MHTIFKYPIQTTDEQVVRMPEGAEILCVQMQGYIPCIWAKVDKDNELTERVIQTYGTGHSIRSNALNYIGTYQLHGGTLVFHVFEEI